MPRKVHPPIHPGEILQEEYLEPLGLTQYRLAKDISVPPRRMGHRQTARDELAARHVDNATSMRLIGSPAVARIGRAERGDVAGSTIDERQAIQVTAVFGGKCRDERRTPARHETVIGIERT